MRRAIAHAELKAVATGAWCGCLGDRVTCMGRTSACWCTMVRDGVSGMLRRLDALVGGGACLGGACDVADTAR